MSFAAQRHPRPAYGGQLIGFRAPGEPACSAACSMASLPDENQPRNPDPGTPAMTADWFFAALRRDRAVVLGSLALVVALAWLWLWVGAGIDMEEIDMGGGQMMLMAPEWSISYGLVVFALWAVMMVAMMLLSAAPVILLVVHIARKRDAVGLAM